MAKAVFLQAQTAVFAAGFTACAAWTLTLGAPPHGSAAEIVARLGGIAVFSLLEAALFSLGAAWAGVQRPPRLRWVFVAGLVTGAGLVAVASLMGGGSSSGDLEDFRQRGYQSAAATIYAVVAPALAGFCFAASWRRRN